MLIDDHKKIIDYHISKYRGGDVPDQVLRSKAKLIYADTLKQYDPSKGEFEALLNKNLMSLNRFVSGSMQIRMPEHKHQKTRMVMDTINDVDGDDDNIDYSHIGKLLHMKPKTIKSIYAGATRKIVSDPSIEDFVSVPNSAQSQYDTTALYNGLPDQLHKDIFDYTMGEHGKTAIKTNAGIARQLGISESYVRKIKDNILKDVK